MTDIGIEVLPYMTKVWEQYDGSDLFEHISKSGSKITLPRIKSLPLGLYIRLTNSMRGDDASNMFTLINLIAGNEEMEKVNLLSLEEVVDMINDWLAYDNE